VSTPESQNSETSLATRSSLKTHCGFIGLIGRPNVGKSTLLNCLLGQQIAITADKPQTTRNRILGILTEEEKQFIFMDTPGIHQDEKKLLNQKMVDVAVQTLKETDLNLFLVEPNSASRRILSDADLHILQLLKSCKTPIILLINKIDTVSEAEILQSIEFRSKTNDFEEIIPISALKKRNTEHLLKVLKSYIPESPFYFESDQITDVPEKFLAGEFVREALFRRLQQELPYSIAIQVDLFKEKPKIIHIECTIFVERDSQKGIVIGKQGQMLKHIGMAARKKIERLLGKQVHLGLHVKVVKQWTQSSFHLKNIYKDSASSGL